jgi:hypothetical protein
VTVDSYLAELRRLLPRTARLRVLPEVREHLRDAAARHRAEGASPGNAEMLATAEFGDVRGVAARLGRELAIRETRIAALLVLGVVALFIFPLYVIPENTLPPAPSAEKPSELLALERAALGLWLAAGMLATVSAVLAWSRWRRAVPVALIATAAAIAGASGVSGALFWRWSVHTPSTPNLALANALALPIVIACVTAAWWTVTSRRRLNLVA